MNLLSYSSGGQKSEMDLTQGVGDSVFLLQALVKNLFSLLFQLSASSYGRRGEGVLWSLLYKGTNPIHEGFTLMT